MCCFVFCFVLSFVCVFLFLLLFLGRGGGGEFKGQVTWAEGPPHCCFLEGGFFCFVFCLEATTKKNSGFSRVSHCFCLYCFSTSPFHIISLSLYIYLSFCSFFLVFFHHCFLFFPVFFFLNLFCLVSLLFFLEKHNLNLFHFKFVFATSLFWGGPFAPMPPSLAGGVSKTPCFTVVSRGLPLKFRR